MTEKKKPLELERFKRVFKSFDRDYWDLGKCTIRLMHQKYFSRMPFLEDGKDWGLIVTIPMRSNPTGSTGHNCWFPSLAERSEALVWFTNYLTENIKEEFKEEKVK